MASLGADVDEIYDEKQDWDQHTTGGAWGHRGVETLRKERLA